MALERLEWGIFFNEVEKLILGILVPKINFSTDNCFIFLLKLSSSQYHQKYLFYESILLHHQ